MTQIPFDPFDAHVLYYQNWRRCVQQLKVYYSLELAAHAMVQNMRYETELALKINQLKKEGKLQ